MVRLEHTSDPKVAWLIEETGLAVSLTFTLGSWGGVKVNPKGNYNTPGKIIADYELAGGYYYGTEGKIKFYERAAELMKLDGFIAQYLYNCRPVATISHIQSKEPRFKKRGIMKGNEGDCIHLTTAPHSSPP